MYAFDTILLCSTSHISWWITIDHLTNPTIHLSHIPQCTIQNRNVHISVLNGVLWGMPWTGAVLGFVRCSNTQNTNSTFILSLWIRKISGWLGQYSNVWASTILQFVYGNKCDNLIQSLVVSEMSLFPLTMPCRLPQGHCIVDTIN